MMTQVAVQAGDLSPTLQTRKARPGEMESHGRKWHRAICLQAQGFWYVTVGTALHCSEPVTQLILSLRVVVRIK